MAERPLPDVPGVEHRFVDAGFLRMHFAEAGPPDGDPVVLLHGWPQHWYMWRHQIGPLAERYRVICPDLRGFGWTEAPMWGYEKQRFADDVLALLDELGLERVKLAGHDWGGLAGFLLCLRHPERVDRFVALNTGGPWADISAAAVSTLWRFWYQAVLSAPLLGWRAASAAPVVARLARSWAMERDAAWSSEDAAIFLDQFREPARARATMLTYRSFLTRELPRFVRGRFDDLRLSTPTLFLHGDADPVIRPQLLGANQRRADDMRVELVESIGHFIAEEAPELVTGRMLDFFAGPEPGSVPGAVAEAAT